MYKKLLIKGIIAGIIVGICVECYFFSKYIFQKSFELSIVELETIQNEKIDLNSLEGKPFVLNFLSKGCVPCIKELPEFEKAAIKYKDSIQFLFIMEEEIKEIVKFKTKYNLEFVHSKKDFEEYGILGVPRTYFINSHGLVIDSSLGSIDSIQLAKYLMKLN